MWAKYAPLLDDAFNVTGDVDGAPLIVRKAYNSIAPSAARFIGYWADVTLNLTLSLGRRDRPG